MTVKKKESDFFPSSKKESGDKLKDTRSSVDINGSKDEKRTCKNDEENGKGDSNNLKKRAAEADVLEKELEKMRALSEEYKEEAARSKADFYNYRTRVERDRARDRVLAAEGTVDELLPVLDNLDRTLDAVEDKESPLYKGVAMVQRQFFSALQSLGLEIIDTDCAFDPKFHEAMMLEEVEDDSKNGAILEVFYRGYRLGEKVLRAAQVKVGKKK